ncbi:putative transcriptional regulator [Frankia sp. AiPs1]|uniref:MerR family transcriptional regulator n=1 Tax=Frankia sp. AiPa1 TaxID=573492 RepID=UPI00202AFF92|nr:MerR family transcriptional regulator [Frankia sp. AiPa1]MCL9761393.1 MerR family transcriptional regulator [Frankia sp. AiPa1]
MSTASSATPSADARGSRYEIGDVATLVTLSLRTARFYEQEGLLVAVDRTASGFPLYDEDALDRFFLIKKMKPLGFTVEEMRSLLTLREEIGKPGLTVAHRAQVRDRLQAWVGLAEEKLAALQEQVRLAEDFMIGLRDDAARSLYLDTDHPGADTLDTEALDDLSRSEFDIGRLALDDSLLDFLTEPLRDSGLLGGGDASGGDVPGGGVAGGGASGGDRTQHDGGGGPHGIEGN